MKLNILIPAPILAFLLFTNVGFSQTAFSDLTADLVNTSLSSGVAMGVADMNGDGFDDIVRLDNANNLEIEYQGAGGVWTNYNFGSTGSGGEWSICVADVDQNGYNDVLTGGAYNSLKLLKANGTGTALTSTTLSGPNIFLQGSNFADINNDGFIDIFACHDDGISSPYENDGAGNFTYDLGLINTASTIPSDNSGNYGSTWTDYDGDGDLDLYISKCRFGASDPLDGRRVNLLFQNDGNNNFTDVAEAAGLRPLAQSWSSDFADIDNDGDLDVIIINHDILSQLFQNNGDGTFTEITAGSGLEAGFAIIDPGIQCKFEDFDNDGFVDLLVTGISIAHRLFWNDGDLTFTESDPFPTGGDRIHSAAIGDLDHDGFIDVIAGFANGFNGPSSIDDRYFRNVGNSNNFISIQLTGTESNINGIGAMVEAYGAWGKQIRELRAGESYGVFNSFTAHFGLGSSADVDSVIVRWPSGNVDKVVDPQINDFLSLTEGSASCYVPFPGVDEGSLATAQIGNAFSTSWDPVDGQIGCQLQVRFAGGSILGAKIVGGANADGFNIPAGALQAGMDYEWRVRCGCSQNPLVAGPFSSWQPFSTAGGAGIVSNPNPTEGISNVTFTMTEEGYATLEVFDMNGRKVEAIFSGQANPKSEYRFVFDGSGLPNGVYIYRLTTDRLTINEKFILAK